MCRSYFFLLFMWCSALTLRAQTTSAPVPPPLKNDFEGILSFLSSDWMEGRETGTRGASMAADYVASMMQLNGLMPYGDAKISNSPGSPVQTFFQNFKIIRCRVERSSLELIRNSSEGEPVIIFARGTDFVVDPVPFAREAEAAVVFVGYGIEAPGKGYNDYAGADVRNKVVVVVDGYPGHADTTSFAWKKLGRSFEDEFATIRKKLKLAERHGAAAVVFIDPDVLNSKINELRSGDGDDETPRHYLPGDTGKLKTPCFTLGTDAILQLLDGAGIDLPGFEKKAAGDLLPASRLIQGKKLRFSVTVSSEEVPIRNVIGMIQGIDTTRNIIIGGHYDHLGVRKGEVYNGADDNASGVAGMLALAKAWSSHPGKPPCNLIFAAWIGEERGKLGSTYYAMHSRLVPGQVSLVINMDMISRSAPEDTGRIGLSIGTLTLNEDLRSLAKRVNSKLEHPFVLELWDVTGATGSDYRPFSDRKVPILTFHAGFPVEYHTPLDDFARVDLHKMEQILKIVNDCLWETLKNPPLR
ncbi:MAG: M20/M25/M40 family metallo-hydrolase [Bacteroidota bacterium]